MAITTHAVRLATIRRSYIMGKDARKALVLLFGRSDKKRHYAYGLFTKFSVTKARKILITKNTFGTTRH